MSPLNLARNQHIFIFFNSNHARWGLAPMCTITISNPPAPSGHMLRGRKGQKGHILSEYLHSIRVYRLFSYISCIGEVLAN